jgi:ABC-2 type transport system ATP-binding protein
MIQLQEVRKSFGQVQALAGLSLHVGAGEVYGLLGPNGAGKTTAFRILATLTLPDAGSVRLDGTDAVESPREVRRQLGFMPDLFRGHDTFLVEQYLHYFGALYGLVRRERRRRVEEVLELVELQGKREAPVRGLSRGMQQRLCLARTLLHDPGVLILDEPAGGLDPRARIEIRSLLTELRAMGKTLILSSHILPELETLCDRVGLLEEGRLVAEGTLDEIAATLEQPGSFRLRTRLDEEEARVRIENLPTVHRVLLDRDAGGVYLRILPADSGVEAEALLRDLLPLDLGILLFMEETPDLEEVFMRVTRGGAS